MFGGHLPDTLVHLADVACAGARTATDVWAQHPLDIVDDALRLTVPAHGCRLVRLER
jgi:hypothetical protein